MKRFVFRGTLSLCLLGLHMLTFAQDDDANYPEVGKPLPDFALNNIQQFSKKTLTAQNQKGRHFILDFFSSGCTSCVEAFPKTNKLYGTFKNQLDIVLVGREDKYIRPMYEKFRQRQQLQLPVAFDSALCNRWVPQGYPHLIWVDEKGIVRAITASSMLNEQNIRSFIGGEKLDFFDRGRKASIGRDTNTATTLESFKINDAGVIAASILSRWDGKSHQSAADEFYADQPQFESRCMLLQWLYNIAYWGKASITPGDSLYESVARYPVAEMADASAFDFNFEKTQGLYNYSQVVPAGRSIQYKQQLLRDDLRKAFGYTVDVETRLHPVYRLIAKEGAYELLKTKGGMRRIENAIPHTDYRMTNYPIKQLIRLIWSYHQGGPLFIDESGITGNIDIHLDGIITDLEDVRKMLQKYKLDLVKGEKEIQVLVIRDPTEISK